MRSITYIIIIIALLAIPASSKNNESSYWNMFQFPQKKRVQAPIFSGTELFISGGGLFPMNAYSERLENGYGINTAFLGKGRLAYFGLESGFHFFPGTNNNQDNQYLKKTKHLFTVPMILHIAPYIKIAGPLKAVLNFGPGVSFTAVNYQSGTPSLLADPEYEYRTAFLPLIKSGVKFSFTISEAFSLSLGSDFYLIMEMTGNNKIKTGYYTMALASAEIRF